MRRRVLVLVTASWICVATAHAQTTGTIGGWIVDSSGAALAGVTVEASGASLQGRRSSVTQRDGTYRLPALPPGRYTLRASLRVSPTSSAASRSRPGRPRSPG